MIKNIKKFLKESEKKKNKFLRSLTLKEGIKILEKLITSKLLGSLIISHKDHPLSLEKSLKYAKLSR